MSWWPPTSNPKMATLSVVWPPPTCQFVDGEPTRREDRLPPCDAGDLVGFFFDFVRMALPKPAPPAPLAQLLPDLL